MTDHRVTATVDECGAYYRPHPCPHDPADTARPCWPWTENDEPEPDTPENRSICTWYDWIENAESCIREWDIELVVTDCDWADSPSFTVRPLRDLGADE